MITIVTIIHVDETAGQLRMYTPIRNSQRKDKKGEDKFDANPQAHMSLLEVQDYDPNAMHASLRYRSISEDHMEAAGGFIDKFDEATLSPGGSSCMQQTSNWVYRKIKQSVLGEFSICMNIHAMCANEHY